jgi:hypothetical protein
VLISFLYATSPRIRSLRPIRVPSDQNTRWRLSFYFFTDKRQEFIISPYFSISRYLPESEIFAATPHTCDNLHRIYSLQQVKMIPWPLCCLLLIHNLEEIICFIMMRTYHWPCVLLIYSLILPFLLNHGRNDKKSRELWYYIITVEAVAAKTACMYCYVFHPQLSYCI